MHIHTHFRHHYSFLISYVIFNKKRFLVGKKSERKTYHFQINKRKHPCNSITPPAQVKEKKKGYTNTELTKLSFLHCEKGEFISIKNVELPQLKDTL